MINFYKEDEIGKAAFADGSIYTPQGNVSLLLDATTKQIVIAEDEKIIYWINTSEELQVNGTAITGTDAEKLALIAPIFQGAAGGTGGGTGGKFGIDDTTTSQNRAVDMQNHNFTLENAKKIYLHSAATDGSYLEIYGEDGGVILEANSGNNDYAQIQIDKTGFLKVFAQQGLINSTISFEGGIKIKVGENDATRNPALAKTTVYSFANIAQHDGVEVPQDILSIPTQQYASNADAVAALGVDKLYKSTTLINGSPITLITE